MADGDFYSRDRPDQTDLPEDRPRGAGPESGSRRGFHALWTVVLALIVLFVVMALLFGI
ncbi:hypothetical protein ACFOOM_29275 [Streptomyces echinoruber]|uniref:Uncharacterized protein n=1 Tax=Streptomyces echinoruber TaxID=68898 RepID=A0A918RF22_9ACTN|nr:hypothetical protein [Streptomyces echinoruber]GGZ94175.1 hypothetical protein GCM10010389_36130 [Streptomyces echinoruber]